MGDEGSLIDKREHPFFIVDNRVLDVGLPAVALATYMAVARYSNRKGEAWPGLELLSEKAGVCTRTVMRSLDLLVERGLLRIDKQPGRPNVYMLLDPPNPDTESVVSAEPVTVSHPTRDCESPHPCHRVTTPVTQSHPIKNQEQESSNQTQEQHSSSSDTESPQAREVGGADDDENKTLHPVVEQALSEIGLVNSDLAELPPDELLALVWAAKERAKSNPGGLLLAMLAGGQKPEPDSVALARVALEHGVTTPEAARREQRKAELTQFAQETEEILAARKSAATEPPGEKSTATRVVESWREHWPETVEELKRRGCPEWLIKRMEGQVPYVSPAGARIHGATTWAKPYGDVLQAALDKAKGE